MKTLKTNCVVSVFLFLLFVQEINPDLKEDRLNFILPGCLYPYKKLICNLFNKEKSKFLANKRFLQFFLTPLCNQLSKTDRI